MSVKLFNKLMNGSAYITQVFANLKKHVVKFWPTILIMGNVKIRIMQYKF